MSAYVILAEGHVDGADLLVLHAVARRDHVTMVHYSN